MNKDAQLSGYITYYSKYKAFGYIDIPAFNMEDIIFTDINLNSKYTTICPGDSISLKIGMKEDGESYASDICFVENTKIKTLRDNFNNQILLRGYIKKIGKDYYIRDVTTGVFIHLVISEYESDIKQNYDERQDQITLFKIVQMSESNSMTAILTNRKFIPEYNNLISHNTVDAKVISVEKGGCKVRVFNKIDGFLPNRFLLKREKMPEAGDTISVICLNGNSFNADPVFDLASNITENENNTINWETINKGDIIKGNIVSIKESGIYISLGFSEELLLFNKVIENYFLFPPMRMLKEVFKTGSEITVEVEYASKGKIILTFDKTNEENKKMYDLINQSHRLWLEGKDYLINAVDRNS